MQVRSTLFVPDNSGLAENKVGLTEWGSSDHSSCVLTCLSPQTLSQRDIEFHLSEGLLLPLSQLKNGSRIKTRVGSLTVLGVTDLFDPTAQVRRPDLQVLFEDQEGPC